LLSNGLPQFLNCIVLTVVVPGWWWIFQWNP